MPLQLCDGGAELLLESFFNKVVAGTYVPVAGDKLVLKLYVDDETPSTDGSDTVAKYTEAGAGHGYAAIDLAAGSWTVSTVATIAQAAFAKQTFTWTSNPTETVYGYFVVNSAGDLVWAERAAATFTPTANGDYFEVTPVFKLSGGTPA